MLEQRMTIDVAYDYATDEEVTPQLVYNALNLIVMRYNEEHPGEDVLGVRIEDLYHISF